jgi:hypothetical protein
MLLVWIFIYQEKTIDECLDIALKLAALKLQNVGRLPVLIFYRNFIKYYAKTTKNISVMV